MTPAQSESIARRCFAALQVAHSMTSDPSVKKALETVIRECVKGNYIPRPGTPVVFREDL